MALIKKDRASLPDLILSIIYPHRCPVCDGVFYFGDRKTLHPECRRKLAFTDEGPWCLKCGRPLPAEEAEYCFDCSRQKLHFTRNIALMSYNEAARASMVRFKYSGRQEYARFYADELMARRGEELAALRADAILPVPIHRSRLLKRGYNQAELVALRLSKALGVPLRRNILLRVKHTEAQKELGPEERIRNMQHALKVRGDLKGLRTVLLVDDIYTTGSTLEACTRVLLAAGIEKVYAVTVCVVSGE